MSKIKDWLFDTELDRKYDDISQPPQRVSSVEGYAGIKLKVKPHVEHSRRLPEPSVNTWNKE